MNKKYTAIKVSERLKNPLSGRRTSGPYSLAKTSSLNPKIIPIIKLGKNESSDKK